MSYASASLSDTEFGLAGTATTTTEAKLEAEHAALGKSLHGLAVSINVERERGNVQGVRALLAKFQEVAKRRSELNRQLTGMALSGWETFILNTGRWVEESLAALPNAISALPKAAASGILQAVLPFVGLYLGYNYLSKGKLL